MILKQGHTYRAMPHDGKLIAYIYRGGRCYYIASPYSPEATQALKAAFPAYWTAIRDYGLAHPQLVPFINEDPMLIVSLVEVGKVRYARGGVSCQVSTGIVPTDTMQINSMFRMNEMTQYSPVYQQGYMNENGNWTRFAVRNGKNNEVIFNLNNFTTTSIIFESSIIGKWLDTEMTQQGIVVNGTDYPSKGISKGNENNNPIWLFGRGDTYGMENIDIASFETIDGEQRHNLVPFVREGANYLLDTETCELTQGTFTIELTDKAT